MSAAPRTSHEPRAEGRAFLGERRPERALMTYYALQSLLAGPGLIFLLPYLWFRYHTLRYTFDEQGVTVRWGILFRKEISLTYARIQDIHLVSNVVERWLGLGRVQIQTASGQSGAELTVEGFADYEAVRDELYVRMRGARGVSATSSLPAAAGVAALAHGTGGDDVVMALNEAVAELRALREELGRPRS
jgi:membrane protein YdbS with pleckstrin-like domain